MFNKIKLMCENISINIRHKAGLTIEAKRSSYENQCKYLESEMILAVNLQKIKMTACQFKLT